jgi:hypothetical protein
MVYTRNSETTDEFITNLEAVIEEVTSSPNEEAFGNLNNLIRKISSLLEKN